MGLAFPRDGSVYRTGGISAGENADQTSTSICRDCHSAGRVEDHLFPTVPPRFCDIGLDTASGRESSSNDRDRDCHPVFWSVRATAGCTGMQSRSSTRAFRFGIGMLRDCAMCRAGLGLATTLLGGVPSSNRKSPSSCHRGVWPFLDLYFSVRICAGRSTYLQSLGCVVACSGDKHSIRPLLGNIRQHFQDG